MTGVDRLSRATDSVPTGLCFLCAPPALMEADPELRAILRHARSRAKSGTETTAPTGDRRHRQRGISDL